jgi:hypothetical protein
MDAGVAWGASLRARPRNGVLRSPRIALGLTPTPCWKRVKDLGAAGVIRDYSSSLRLRARNDGGDRSGLAWPEVQGD